MIKRRFLVTGASKGIGRALSERLAKAGHHVVGLAREASDFPGELVTVDLSRRAEAAAALASLAVRHAFDGVVNNVGLVRPQPVDKVTLDDLDAVLALNLHSAGLTVQATLPAMRAKGWGRIVNISSLTILGITQRTAYAAAKAALVSFARSWALELAETGITVNAVAPGPTETELFRQNTPAGSPQETRFFASLPVGHIGRPEQIAAAISLLLSEDGGYTTGQVIRVDGGGSLPGQWRR